MEPRRWPSSFFLSSFLSSICTTFDDERLWVMWTIAPPDQHPCALRQAVLSARARTFADDVFGPAKCQFSVRLDSQIIDIERFKDLVPVRQTYPSELLGYGKMLDNHFRLAVTFAPETLDSCLISEVLFS